MKTTILKFFTLSAAIFAFSNISFAQEQKEISATSSVTIIKPITITKERDLVYGSIVSSTTSDVPVGATIITPLTIKLSAGTQLQFGTIVADATSAATVLLSPNTAIATTLTHLGENSVPTFNVTASSEGSVIA